MKCPEPSIKKPCYFCYNGECYANHWWGREIAENVEYVRADAFIKKACEYFRRGLEDTKVIDYYRNILVRGIHASYTSVEEFIENFKEYIEGE